MTMTVGIMGFGRIGRNVFRILYKRDDILIRAVSDLPATTRGLQDQGMGLGHEAATASSARSTSPAR